MKPEVILWVKTVASYPVMAGSFCRYGDAVLALAEDAVKSLR